jgi:hypothetical protein
MVLERQENAYIFVSYNDSLNMVYNEHFGYIHISTKGKRYLVFSFIKDDRTWTRNAFYFIIS